MQRPWKNYHSFVASYTNAVFCGSGMIYSGSDPDHKSNLPLLVQMPPLLVQRCNGTTAGLGYLEVNLICPCKSPNWAVRLSGVRTVDPHWGEWHNSSADCIPNHNYVNAAPDKQASRLPHVHTTNNPQAQLLYTKCTRLNTNLYFYLTFHQSKKFVITLLCVELVRITNT